MAQAKEFNLEQALGQLEKIVAEMENKDTDLNKALALFEKGIQLSRECQNNLEQAEQKIQLLQKGVTDSTLTPFEVEEK